MKLIQITIYHTYSLFIPIAVQAGVIAVIVGPCAGSPHIIVFAIIVFACVSKSFVSLIFGFPINLFEYIRVNLLCLVQVESKLARHFLNLSARELALLEVGCRRADCGQDSFGAYVDLKDDNLFKQSLCVE